MKAKLKPRIDLVNRTKLETVIPLAVPYVIFIDPSDVCNFQCKFCPTGDRPLMRATPGRNYGTMPMDLYKKIINDICEFEKPLRVLRLYKDGEPLVNPRFPEMIRYAKDRKCAERIDTTTNASLLTPEKSREIIDAGLDRMNISIYGMNNDQYTSFAGFKGEFEQIVSNVRFFYEHRGRCEMIVKINGDTISAEDKERFFQTFGDYTDGIFVEHVMSCWPEFELRGGVVANSEFGIYGQQIREVSVCPYVFYAFSINSDGSVSACFLDWSRDLLIGDAKTEKVTDIWRGKKMREHQKMFLRNERKSHPTCGNCGQMTHGMPDNIDMFAEKLLPLLETQDASAVSPE